MLILISNQCSYGNSQAWLEEKIREAFANLYKPSNMWGASTMEKIPWC
jgi:hypothetical protein